MTSPVRAPALRVPAKEGETVRRDLLERGLLRRDLKVVREGAHLLLPLASVPAQDVAGEVVEGEFEPMPGPASPYTERLKLPSRLQALLPTSFDLIGDVLIVRLPDELVLHKREIGEALLHSVKSARTIALDRGVQGEFRVRELEVVAGEPDTRTLHVEHGVRLRVDPATCYFSPRLATERRRVADLVRPGERVVDLFAGVGPFALVIARHAQPARVDAVDANPHAVELLRENVRLNRADAIVHAHLADARAWALAHPGVADRVITNLPHTAHAFLDAALAVLKPGGVWHYHTISSPAALPEHVAQLRATARRLGRNLAQTFHREVRTYSPSERHYAVDLDVEPL